MEDPIQDEEVYIATESHISHSTDFLTFLKGDEIFLIERIDEDTWKVYPLNP